MQLQIRAEFKQLKKPLLKEGNERKDQSVDNCCS
jgi:hypothetical protein